MKTSVPLQLHIIFVLESYLIWHDKSYNQLQVKVAKAQRGRIKLNLPRWHISTLIPVDISVSTDVWVFRKPHLACPQKRGGSKDQSSKFVPDEEGFDISDGELDLGQTLAGCQGSGSGTGLVLGRWCHSCAGWLTGIPAWLCPIDLDARLSEFLVEPAGKCAMSKSRGATSSWGGCLAPSTALAAEIRR